METQESVTLARSTVYKDQAEEYTNLCNRGKRPHRADWPITADYQHALDRFVATHGADYVLVGDRAWTEIDFAEDVERAERDVLPRLDAGRS